MHLRGLWSRAAVEALQERLRALNGMDSTEFKTLSADAGEVRCTYTRELLREEDLRAAAEAAMPRLKATVIP